MNAALKQSTESKIVSYEYQVVAPGGAAAGSNDEAHPGSRQCRSDVDANHSLPRAGSEGIPFSKPRKRQRSPEGALFTPCD